MDSVFSPLTAPSDRNTYLRSLLRSFGCSYICLWLYSPQPTDHLFFLDGLYNEDSTQPGSSSSGSFARRLFDDYQKEVFFLINDRVPGMAFMNNLHYQELNESDLQRMASICLQRHFYQVANIKTAVFLGCRSGEIEMGWSNSTYQVNMENSIRKWFSLDTSYPPRQQQSPSIEVSQAIDTNRVSPTISSPLSLDSPENSPFSFNLPSNPTLHIQEPPEPPAASLMQAIPSTSNQIMQFLQSSTNNTSTSHHQAAFELTRSTHLPIQELENEAMTRAILAVLTSSSTPELPRNRNLPQSSSAFKKYLAPITASSSGLRPNFNLRQTMFKRSITYYTNLNIERREQLLANRPTSTQLHHMISERKRREKINESFEALRKLLPPESKKDKASVLSRTREYLSSLKDQVEDLSKRNKKLEGQLMIIMPVLDDQDSSGDQRVDVRISESTSEDDHQRMINLQVVLRGECPVSDMVIRILEFLKLDKNVSLMSMEASSTVLEESRSSNRVILRLRIEGNEWDECAFLEAVKRVVADLA